MFDLPLGALLFVDVDFIVVGGHRKHYACISERSSGECVGVWVGWGRGIGVMCDGAFV